MKESELIKGGLTFGLFAVKEQGARSKSLKEPKSVTAFDLFTFFRADLIQLEASWKLSSTSDWLMSA